MSLIEFVKVITGLAIGLIVTWSIFLIGYLFIEEVLFAEKPPIFILVLSVLFWVTISYGVVAWVM